MGFGQGNGDRDVSGDADGMETGTVMGKGTAGLGHPSRMLYEGM